MCYNVLYDFSRKPFFPSPCASIPKIRRIIPRFLLAHGWAGRTLRGTGNSLRGWKSGNLTAFGAGRSYVHSSNRRIHAENVEKACYKKYTFCNRLFPCYFTIYFAVCQHFFFKNLTFFCCYKKYDFWNKGISGLYILRYVTPIHRNHSINERG